MNEGDWLTCDDTTPMLRFLLEHPTSERKLRLLACACCRRIWHLLRDPRSREAVEVAERYADEQATLRELGQARVRYFRYYVLYNLYCWRTPGADGSTADETDA